MKIEFFLSRTTDTARYNNTTTIRVSTITITVMVITAISDTIVSTTIDTTAIVSDTPDNQTIAITLGNSVII